MHQQPPPEVQLGANEVVVYVEVRRCECRYVREFFNDHRGLAQQRVLGQQADQRVDLRVQRLDARQAGLQHLARRHLAAVDGRAQGAAIELRDVVGVHGVS